MRGRPTVHFRDTQHLIFQIGIFKVFIIACTYKTLFANPLTYIIHTAYKGILDCYKMLNTNVYCNVSLRYFIYPPIADITSVWDELNDRSAGLEHLLSCGQEDSSFERSINMICEHVDSMEIVLVEERVPSDLATAEIFLKEHKVDTCVHT